MHTCVCRLLLFALVFEEVDDARLVSVVNGVFLFWPSLFLFYWFCRCLALLCTSRCALLLLALLLGRLHVLVRVIIHLFGERSVVGDLVTEAAFSIVKHMAACPHKCEARAA